MPIEVATGGPAFPRAVPSGEFPPDDCLRIISEHAGMTLRDYFAAHAITVANQIATGHEVWRKTSVARTAYEIADEMLKAREK